MRKRCSIAEKQHLHVLHGRLLHPCPANLYWQQKWADAAASRLHGQAVRCPNLAVASRAWCGRLSHA